MLLRHFVMRDVISKWHVYMLTFAEHFRYHTQIKFTLKEHLREEFHVRSRNKLSLTLYSHGNNLASCRHITFFPTPSPLASKHFKNYLQSRPLSNSFQHAAVIDVVYFLSCLLDVLASKRNYIDWKDRLGAIIIKFVLYIESRDGKWKRQTNTIAIRMLETLITNSPPPSSSFHSSNNLLLQAIIII